MVAPPCLSFISIIFPQHLFLERIHKALMVSPSLFLVCRKQAWGIDSVRTVLAYVCVHCFQVNADLQNNAGPHGSLIGQVQMLIFFPQQIFVSVFGNIKIRPSSLNHSFLAWPLIGASWQPSSGLAEVLTPLIKERPMHWKTQWANSRLVFCCES